MRSTTLPVPGPSGSSTRDHRSLSPHSEQNLAPGGFSAPHCWHLGDEVGDPQLLQNLPWPAGLPQLGHMACL